MKLSTKWLAGMNTEWQIINPKLIFEERVGKSLPDDVHLTPSQTYGVLPQSEYMEKNGTGVVLNLVGADNMKHVEKNDFIIHLRSFQGGIEHSSYAGKVSNAYCVLKTKAEVEPRFFRWVLKSTGYIQELNSTTNQLRDGQSIKFEQFASIGLPVPPIEAQRRIADYLDSQVLLIDHLIELKEKANEVYVEAFASLKHATVTAEGCGNQVSTGLVWMPKAPKEWRKISLQSHISWRKGIDSGRLNAEYCGQHEGIYPVYSGQTANNGIFAQINTYDFDFIEKCLLMSTVGALAGRTKLIGGKFSLSQNCAILVAQTRDISLEFLNYLWPSIWSVMSSQIPSDMQPSVRFSDLAKQWLVLPSIDEQQRIVEVISKAQKNSDALVSTAKSQIEGLRELKSSLITAAVTGTFDVTTRRSVA